MSNSHHIIIRFVSIIMFYADLNVANVKTTTESQTKNGKTIPMNFKFCP